METVLEANEYRDYLSGRAYVGGTDDLVLHLSALGIGGVAIWATRDGVGYVFQEAFVFEA